MNLAGVKDKLQKGDIGAIAADCGLHRASVSAVLNGKKTSVSTETRVLRSMARVVALRNDELREVKQLVAQL